MRNIFRTLFGKRCPCKYVPENVIESDKPYPVKGIPYTDVIKMKRYLEQLKKGESFPFPPTLAYTSRKLAKDHFPEYKISIRNTGAFYSVYRLA